MKIMNVCNELKGQGVACVNCQMLTVVKPRGSSLVEVLVALGILGVVVGAIGSAVASSLRNAQAAKDKTFATKYAQEGMEAIRELRNKNYIAFRNYSGTYCLGSLPAVLNQRGCTTPNVGIFIRSTTIDQSGCGANVARVAVTLSWSDGTCPASNQYCHISSHNTCLSTVNPIQAP